MRSQHNTSGLIVPNGDTLPPQRIFFLVKFLSAERVEGLLRGRLYAKRLSSFKQSEDRTSAGRLDRYEGTSSWMQPGSHHLELNGWNMTPDLAGPTQIQPDWFNHLNVFCLHAVHADGLGLDRAVGGDVEDLQQRLMIPERCFELGEHAVVITDVPEFMRRFGTALKTHRYRGWSHLVRYYDPSIFHGHFEGIDAVFRKRSEYSYQREYRFAIDTGTTDDAALHLDIGDIRDITKRFRSEELNGEQFLGGTIQVE